MIFSSIKNKIIRLIQLFLVVLFILFEEVIWEGIARPIYTYIHTLKLLRKIEALVRWSPPVLVLFIFIVLFVAVELLGVYAGVLLVSGKALLSIVLYAGKIPIAAFTFWLFRVSEQKLMTFSWFAWMYQKIMDAIVWIKSTDIYQQTRNKAKTIKEKIKNIVVDIKQTYFASEGSFMTRSKQLYRAIKASFKKNNL